MKESENIVFEMQNNTIDVCRFCLKLIHGENAQLINNEATRKMLGVLLIKLDLDMSEDPLMCSKCSDILYELFDFKSKCLNSEEIIRNHFMRHLKVSLRNILIGTKDAPGINIEDHELMCRLCNKNPPNGSYISLVKTGAETSFSRDVIQSQLPEIDLWITKEPVICYLCNNLLKKYTSFVTTCMQVEREIKLYCELQGNDNKGQVDLWCVMYFRENKAVNSKSGSNEDVIVKQEGLIFVMENEINDEKNISEDHFAVRIGTELNIKQNNVEIKSENTQTRSYKVQSTEEQLHEASYFMHPILEHSYCRPLKCKITEQCLLHLVDGVVRPCSSYGKELEKTIRYYPDNRNFCKFCKKMFILNIGRHLAHVHKDKVEVQKFMVLPSGSAMRSSLIDKIRSEGNFLFNTVYINFNEAVISVTRSFSNILKYKVPCPKCKIPFLENTLGHHLLHCCPLIRT